MGETKNTSNPDHVTLVVEPDGATGAEMCPIVGEVFIQHGKGGWSKIEDKTGRKPFSGSKKLETGTKVYSQLQH